MAAASASVAALFASPQNNVAVRVDGRLVLCGPRGARGLLDTEATLRVRSHARVFALGDSSAGAGDAATAQVALQQADYAAWNVLSAAQGKALLPVRYQHLGSMATYGDMDGSVTPPLPELPVLTGPLGATARKLAYLYRLPTSEHRLKVAASWAAKDVARFVGDLTAMLGGGGGGRP